MICDWLKEERKRLGFNQERFAESAGVSRRAYAEWESGKTSPTAVQLAALQGIGADVQYIVIGERRSAPVTPGVDFALVVRIASLVESALTKHRARLSLAKKEEMVRLLYEHFALKGCVEEETIERHLKLVVNQ